jgi:hypothetical protein
VLSGVDEIAKGSTTAEPSVRWPDTLMRRIDCRYRLSSLDTIN